MDYTVGWVCALPKEQTAATVMLDHIHADLPKPPNDPNAYTLGSIGKHNVVIACLPKGQIGTNSAAAVADRMVSTFSSIKFGLLVGIGGGIPPKVRLGDVVVSTSVANFPGVVQWDFGKAKEGGNFERTGALNNPPTALLAGLTKLETDQDLRGSKIPEYLEGLKDKWPRVARKFLRSDSLEDVLFRSEYDHVGKNTGNLDFTISDDGDNGDDGEEDNCRFCDKTKVVKRRPRDMRVHYGLIASGNQVIKDARFRDKLNTDMGGHVLCLEMEAAGLMNNFPCIVIRGICDYADSHKNKDWQEHAAAVAAAFAKELLEYVQPSDVDGESPAKDVLNQVLQNTAIVRSGLDRKEDLMILDWLTPIDYGLQHTDLRKRQQPGTGQWFLNSKEFQTWLNTSKQTLFCPGIPGAGKTILTSIVIDHLITRFQSKTDIGIAYIYFNFQRRETQGLGDLLASLLKQLSQGQSSLPERVRELHKRHAKRRTQPSIDEISSSIESVASLYSRVLIIVDGLDECQSSDGCRTRFLSEIFRLQEKTGANILTTSRFILEITKSFKGSASLQIHARNEDVRVYLERCIAESGRRLLKSCREEIIHEITMAVDGMFLLAELHFASLQWKMSPKELRTALRNLPRGSRAYEDAYQATMERIKSQAQEAEQLAIHVLSWVTCVTRPLTKTELRHALAVEIGKPGLDTENLPDIEDIISVCAGLVTMDEENGIIRLVHYTTQEYFDMTQSSWLPNAQREIALTCITYLSFDIFGAEPCSTRKDLDAKFELNPLLEYAGRGWAYHTHAASTEMHPLTLDFLKNRAKVSSCYQATNYLRTHYWDPKCALTGLHLAVHEGLVDALKGLLRDYPNIDEKNNHGQTALVLAVAYGLETMVRQLLKKGANPNPEGKPLLNWAARKRKKNTLRFLLESGANPNLHEHKGEAPLMYALRRGDALIVKLFLESDTNVNFDGPFHKTLLLRAAKAGHEEAVNRLLEKRPDPDPKTHTLLASLLLERYGISSPSDLKQLETMIKSLLITDAVDPDPKDKDGRTPLSYAVQDWRNTGMVKLLLMKGADPNSEDKDNRSPLSYAAETMWTQAIVKLLLQSGARPNSKDKHYRTPRSYAEEKGNAAIVSLLLEHTGELSSKNKDRLSRL